jgi:dihydroflavonol-4-reductase
VKIFITGGTGFIGTHLIQRLSKMGGHEIRCLARQSSDTRVMDACGVQKVMGDVNDREALLRGMDGCDCLLHLANLYSMWRPDPAEFERVNVDGTRMVLECALEAGVKRVVNVSTIAVYGQPAQIPIREETPAGDVLFSEYGRTKAEGDRIAWDLYHTRGLPMVALYPGIVLGAGDDKASGQYIQDIIARRVPSIIFCRSRATYVYVEDVVDAILRAAELPGVVGQRYLIGKHVLDGRAYADLISEISGVRLPWPPYPDFVVMAVSYFLTFLASFTRRPPRWGLSIDAYWTLKTGFVMDGSKAERELGIQYTPVRTALEEAIASYRASR